MDTKKKAFIAPKDQRYYVQIDDFRVTQDKVYRELIAIIENYIKHNTDKKAKLIKNMYKDEISYSKNLRFIINIIFLIYILL